MEKEILSIAEDSTKEFYKERQATDDLNTIASSQLVLINDFATSLQTADEIPEKLKQIDADLALAEEQTRQATSVLTDLLLQGEKDKTTKPDCSDLIKLILNTQYKNIMDIIKDSLKKGDPYISIISLIEFENALATLIENMKDKGMYPIFDEEEYVKRNEKVKQHNQKILSFIQLIQKISNQQ